MVTEQLPRKKRKKRDNTLLFIIVGVAAGVLVLALLITGIVLAVMNLGGGNPQAKGQLPVAPVLENKPPDDKPPPNAPAKDIGEKKRDHTNLRLRAERTYRLNEMRQIGLFYEDFRSTNGNR